MALILMPFITWWWTGGGACSNGEGREISTGGGGFGLVDVCVR